MGRSVATPGIYGQVVAYAHYDETDLEDFDWIVDDYVDQLRSLFPSVYAEDDWLDRECRVVAENKLAQFGISEYCGLVAFWVVPKENEDRFDFGNANPFQKRWVESIETKFLERFGELRSVGHASNGEQFFERIAK